MINKDTVLQIGIVQPMCNTTVRLYIRLEKGAKPYVAFCSSEDIEAIADTDYQPWVEPNMHLGYGAVRVISGESKSDCGFDDLFDENHELKMEFDTSVKKLD